MGCTRRSFGAAKSAAPTRRDLSLIRPPKHPPLPQLLSSPVPRRHRFTARNASEDQSPPARPHTPAWRAGPAGAAPSRGPRQPRGLPHAAADDEARHRSQRGALPEGAPPRPPAIPPGLSEAADRWSPRRPAAHQPDGCRWAQPRAAPRPGYCATKRRRRAQPPITPGRRGRAAFCRYRIRVAQGARLPPHARAARPTRPCALAPPPHPHGPADQRCRRMRTHPRPHHLRCDYPPGAGPRPPPRAGTSPAPRTPPSASPPLGRCAVPPTHLRLATPPPRRPRRRAPPSAPGAPHPRAGRACPLARGAPHRPPWPTAPGFPPATAGTPRPCSPAQGAPRGARAGPPAPPRTR